MRLLIDMDLIQDLPNYLTVLDVRDVHPSRVRKERRKSPSQYSRKDS